MKRAVFGSFLTAVAIASLLSAQGEEQPAAKSPTKLDYARDIRPLLSRRCFQCHGPKKQKAGLRLDSLDSLLKGGDSGSPIKLGKPESSVLIEAINYGPDGFQMPPDGKLKDKEIALLTAWVRQGAPGQRKKSQSPAGKQTLEDLQGIDHWSFQPIAEVIPPQVQQSDWCNTPVDRFILARLEAAGLKPAAPAEKRTLLRRITFDLIGLPPTPEEVNAFLADTSPGAYERVVERLLASPHYGERQTRHWLDLVRFAETAGHEFDFDIAEASQYRDYVIRAFNSDVPYDQFVAEHVAGDLLPKPRKNVRRGFNESIIGTGFYFLGESKHSPVDIREDESARVDNQIDVFSRALLGLTLSCARCHDHKFDPLTTKDYYALAGFLQSSRFQRANAERRDAVRKNIAKINELQQQIDKLSLPLIKRAQTQRVEQLSDYLLGARDVLRIAAELEPAAKPRTKAPSLDKDIVFEDFEKAGHPGWKATGTAFGDTANRRPLPKYQGDVGALGKGFINSHSALKEGQRTAGDNLTGTLTSKTFKIERPYIRFLIGGGAHAETTCLNLRIDGKVVASATGKNNNRMHAAHFDVRAHRGKTASLEIVDNHRTGWGNIGLDHIVFSNNPLTTSSDLQVTAVAQRRGIDPGILARWVKRIRERADADPAGFIRAWADLTAAADTSSPAGFGRWRAAQLARAKQQPNPSAIVFEGFSGDDYRNWFVTGEAFGSTPTKSLSAMPNAQTMLPAGIAHSGLISESLPGVLRSRTFTIEADTIQYRVAGKGAKVRLIIDSFQQIRNPIYGGLEFSINHGDRFKWQVQQVGMWKGHRAYIEILDNGPGYVAVDRIQFTDRRSPPPPSSQFLSQLLKDRKPASAQELAGNIEKLFAQLVRTSTAGQERSNGHSELLAWLVRTDLLPAARPLAQFATKTVRSRLATLRGDRAAIERNLTGSTQMHVLAMTDGTGENERLFIRGNHTNLGEEVERRFLTVLGGAKQPASAQGSGRLELARQMIDPAANPFLPRVMVNRVWQHHFGEGIVRSPDDFGVQGQPPTHPELLDYLSGEFVRGGWSLKDLHRVIVLSATYRMASDVDPAAKQKDPLNKLLHHHPVRRLEAEAIRDAILAISGRLDHKMHGKGVMPHLTPYMLGRGRPKRSGPLDGDGRRSLYISVRRNFLTPMFLAFDYPTPFTTIGKRSVSNVPAQALSLMNNRFVIEQAGVWSKRVLAEKGLTPRQRVIKMYENGFTRPPDDEEIAAAVEFLVSQGRQYGKPYHPKAWADLAHVLFNVKEFIFVN